MNRAVKKIITSLSIVVLVIFLVLISIGSGGITGAVVADAEVGSEVVAAFDQGKDEVLVIVLLKENSADPKSEEEQKEAIKEKQQEVLEDLRQEEGRNFFGLTQEKEFELQYQYETLNALAGEVTEEGLEKLRNDPNVDKIVVSKERQLFLSASVPIVNADDVWNLVVNGYNITGEGETVCVVDTGVDYNHTALTSNYAGGYDFYNNDTDPMDDQGHGTHVAGIIASTDSSYRGVAPGAKIAAVKVCSSGGSCPDADVLAGMDWCIANKDIYNISVISISLGGGQYTSYCDSEVDFAPYAAAINNAAGKNISVVAATGNSGAGSIAGPACVHNVTRVTATTKSDSISSYASRHAFFTDIIAAPGNSIISLKKGGGTISMSGTSMATPHLSGAFALLKQYWKQANGTMPTSGQLEQKILSSGKKVYDLSTNTSFVRLDVLAALQPTLSYTGVPQNNSVLNSTAVVINMSSDVDLSQAWLQWVFPNGSLQNVTFGNTSPTAYTLELTNLNKGPHNYQAYGSDAMGMTGAATVQFFTIDNIAPFVSLLALSTGANLSGRHNLTAEVYDEHSSLSMVLFIINGSNVSVVYSATPQNDSSNVWMKEVNLSELLEGTYTVAAYANDSLGNENESTAAAFSVVIPDVPAVETFLNVEIVAPAAEKFYKNELVIFKVTINSSENISMVNFNLTNTLNVSENIILPASDNLTGWTALVNMSTLAGGNHTLVVIAQDILGKVNDTVSVVFTIDRTSPVLSNITEINVNESSAMIQWTSNELADGKVLYGTSTALGTEMVVSGNDSTSHEVSLFNLAASTLYYYLVTSCDSVDNCNVSEVRNFTTTAVVIVPPPADDDSDDSSSDNSSSDADSSSGSSSDSSSGDSSSSSGSGSGSGSSSGDSDSSSSSSSSSEELAEVEEVSEEVDESVPEETELQVATAEEQNQDEQGIEEQNAETELAAGAEENTSFGNLLTGFVSAVVSVELSSREYVLVGLTALAVILTITFIMIRRRENEMYTN